MKPELAAKKEMVRKQKEQQVTPAERKAAADWLKAERREDLSAPSRPLSSRIRATANRPRH
ncbi:MAG: hypothetical protein MZW92_17485 [Comamonadaceae bacterium]|nr:hypothetical protein [Comamonadaceae bacterium]